MEFKKFNVIFSQALKLVQTLEAVFFCFSSCANASAHYLGIMRMQYNIHFFLLAHLIIGMASNITAPLFWISIMSRGLFETH